MLGSVLAVAHDGSVGIEVFDPHLSDLVNTGAAARGARVHQIARDLGLAINGHVDLLDEAGSAIACMPQGLYTRDQPGVQRKAHTFMPDFDYAHRQRDSDDARTACGGASVYEVGEVRVEDFDADRPSCATARTEPSMSYAAISSPAATVFHGVCRQESAAAGLTRRTSRVYPFGWIGLLSDTPPVEDELIYANHERGFALCSMRSHTRSRYYLQCTLAERVEEMPDERFWAELKLRLDPQVASAWRPGPRSKKHRALAQFRGRADCASAGCSLPRCRAHRSADGRQRAESGSQRHPLPVARA